MANEATIDELQIEIEAESGAAASNLEKLAQALDRLQAMTQRVSSGNDGLNKVVRQINKLNTISQKVQNMPGFEKLGQIVDQLKRLDELNSVGDLSGLTRSLTSIVRASSSISGMDMNAFATNLQGLAAAVQPLSALQGMGDISGAINALGRLPRVGAALSQMDMGTFAQQMQQATAAVQPFVDQMQRLSTAFARIPAPIQEAAANLINYTTHTRQASQETHSLSKALKLVNFVAAYSIIKRIVGYFSSFIESSNAYVENLNLFTVTMGAAADEALEFADAVNAAMGIDISQWIQNQGIFKQMASGFGMVEEKANLLSKNLTQLGYDISSYYNITADAAMQKLQSAMAGEQEPLRRLGYALDEATLKQVALNHGITESISNMSQAQKAQLRYIAIMEQSKKAIGDMTRTIDSPANQLRILESRIETLKRAIGDSLMPVISAALPYVTAFFQILGEAFRNLAAFMGFELPVFDYSDLTKGTDSITAGFEDATEASNKFKGTLAGFDQLNIIGSNSGSGNGSGDLLGNDLNLDLPSYDFLRNLKDDTREAYDAVKNFVQGALPWLEAFAAAWGGIFVTKKISNFLTSISNLKTAMSNLFGEHSDKVAKVFSGIAGGLAAGASSGVLLYNSIKNLITGTGKLGNNIAMLAGGIGIAATAIGLFIKFNNPLGAVLTGVGAIAGAVIGWYQAQKELNNRLAEAVIYSDNAGISIEGLAAGYGNYFDSVSRGYDDIINTNSALNDNRERAEDLATEILNVTDKYRDLGGVMSGEDGDAIKNSIKELGDLATEYIDGVTANAIDRLQKQFSDTAARIGIDVDDLSGKLRLLQGFNKTAVENLTQQADELVAALTSGNLNADEFQTALNELDEVTRKMSLPDVTAESLSFTRALEEMQAAAVNFSDAEALAAIEELGTKADAARSKLQEAQLSQLTELENYRLLSIQTGAAAEFDLKVGAGSFDKMFADMKAAIEEGYNTELSKIDLGEATFYAQISAQLETYTDDYIRRYVEPIAEKAGVSFEEAMELLDVDFGWFNYRDALIGEYKATDAYKELRAAINEGLNGLNVDGAEEIGKYILQGMTEGIINNQQDFNNALNTAALGGLDALRTAFDEHSPSKKTEEMGGYLMEGLVLGVENNTAIVLGAMDTLYEQMRKRQEEFKKQWEKFSLDNYSSEDFIPNLGSAYTTSAKPSNISGVVGGARDAFSGASQNTTTDDKPIVIDSNFQIFVELDGEQVGYAVTQYQQTQQAYSNGR